eukprot:CAMPEP_0183356172 /NCGR_PEP_ID=MMETSP0164_2-20130417/43414_1 /TAXON_ID=221442 /ORGANISM="Coccolithus pelagicus ssp braarudi, Strain PLY182g" /LENGTH=30 /DNA_ID= /DNA_START= /DNA_END= /DNA_ORIENTATION=
MARQAACVAEQIGHPPSAAAASVMVAVRRR